MLVSVIIPAFNEEILQIQTIKRIKFAFNENQNKSLPWELIVCDNNSTDRTVEIAMQMGAKIVFEPVNQISRTRNKGAEIAQGDWLLNIDADTFPLLALVAEVNNLIDDGNYIGCGTTVVVEGGTLSSKLRMERLNPLFRLFNWSSGTFLLFKADAFRIIGGLNTNLYALEYLEFVCHLKSYGRKKRKIFTVLYRNPVITSSRKANYGLITLGLLLFSNIVAVILFGLHYILPGWVIKKLGSNLLGYWYAERC